MLQVEVDERKLNQTRDWLMDHQGKASCFISVGTRACRYGLTAGMIMTVVSMTYWYKI